MELDDYFKSPSEEETSKAWLRQMCWDGQMDDYEVDEFVEAVYKWKEDQLSKHPFNISSTDQIKTKVVEAFNGDYQVRFTIDNQTFSLEPQEAEKNLTSLELAQWYEKQLNIAFSKLDFYSKLKEVNKELDDLKQAVINIRKYTKDEGVKKIIDDLF